MKTTPTDGTILRTEVLGRVRTPQERREHLLDEIERSGLSGQKFAALAGVKYATLATWAQKRRRQRGAYPVVPQRGIPAKTTDKLRWLEAVVETAQGPAAKAGGSLLVLPLADGVRVEISDTKQVELAAALLRARPKPC
jgi:transposase